MKIASFWHSGRLRNLECLCVASWLEVGAEVDLYHFGPISGVPKGVRLRPAAEVLSHDYLDRLVPLLRVDRRVGQPIMNYSDLFRIKLQERGAGIWLDCDLILFRPFPFDPAKPLFAWEDHHRIGSPVFYLPPSSPFIPDYLKVLDDPRLMPHWLGFKRGVLKPLLWKLQGRAWTPPDLGLTIYGNDAFTRLAHKHTITQYALPSRSFYPWNGMATRKFYDPACSERLEDDAEVYGLHIHHKFPHIPRPDPASLYGRMLDRLAPYLPHLDWPEH